MADVSARRAPIASYAGFLKSLLSDRERFFEEVVDGTALRDKLRYAVVTILVLARSSRNWQGAIPLAWRGGRTRISRGWQGT